MLYRVVTLTQAYAHEWRKIRYEISQSAAAAAAAMTLLYLLCAHDKQRIILQPHWLTDKFAGCNVILRTDCHARYSIVCRLASWRKTVSFSARTTLSATAPSEMRLGGIIGESIRLIILWLFVCCTEACAWQLLQNVFWRKVFCYRCHLYVSLG